LSMSILSTGSMTTPILRPPIPILSPENSET
jgi:hypothetical protein